MDNASPIQDGNAVRESVWYGGVDALYEGEAVCFNTDYGTATSFDGNRANRVERPSTSNNQSFAGVAARDYSANSGGQFVEINCPGSRGVNIALGVDTVLDTGLLSFCVNGKNDIGTQTGTDGGRFFTGKFPGRGSAIPRQTVTAVLESSMAGAWSLATDGITLPVASTTGLAAGDTVVLLGGADDGTGSIVAGKYTIDSVTNATVLVLTATAVDTTPGGALTATGYAYTGNPKCQADLLTGDECNGIEFINLPNAGGDSQPYMVRGVSYVNGGVTLAADAEVELAQGTLPGEQKVFLLQGTLTGYDFVVDLATAGIDQDGSTALAEINAIDAAADGCYLVFNGAVWHTLDLVGGATQA